MARWSAPCYRQKSTRYKFLIRDRAKYNFDKSGIAKIFLAVSASYEEVFSIFISIE
jgi:hypothetical protein